MLGKVNESACRLNIYFFRPKQSTRAYSAIGWGFGQLSGRKYIVFRESLHMPSKVLGAVLRRSKIPKEDISLTARVRIVEEGVATTHRSEWIFYVDTDINEDTRQRILNGPLIEPGRLVGDSLHL